MDKHITPEEKLLKHIRKKDNALKAPKKGDAKKSASKDKNRKKFDIIVFSSRFLIFCIVGLMAAIGFRYFSTEAERINPVEEKQVARESVPATDQAIKDFKPYSHYQNDFESTKIFQAPWEKEVVTGALINAVQKTDLNQVIKLVGIMLDDDPKAIVEDIKTRQTSFVSIGETVSGATIKAIAEDKVTFDYQGNTVELNP